MDIRDTDPGRSERGARSSTGDESIVPQIGIGRVTDIYNTQDMLRDAFVKREAERFAQLQTEYAMATPFAVLVPSNAMIGLGGGGANTIRAYATAMPMSAAGFYPRSAAIEPGWVAYELAQEPIANEAAKIVVGGESDRFTNLDFSDAQPASETKDVTRKIELE